MLEIGFNIKINSMRVKWKIKDKYSCIEYKGEVVGICGATNNRFVVRLANEHFEQPLISNCICIKH